MDVWMPAHDEERLIHPERPAAMREQYLQIRKIHRHIVEIHGLAEAAARAGKDRRHRYESSRACLIPDATA